MRKICIQAGHWNTTNGQTGAPRELERTLAIGRRLVEKLNATGKCEALLDDAIPENDQRVRTTDWDVYLSLHCDMDYQGQEGGGFVDWIDPSIDFTPECNAESKRIMEAIEAVYFSQSGIRNVPSRRNANTKFYYMWAELSNNTHCVILEMGESIDPHDNVILNDTERQANILLSALQNAFPDMKPSTPQPVPTDEVAKLKAEITRLNDIIRLDKDPKIERLEKEVRTTKEQCALDVKTINGQKDSVALQLVECQRQSAIYKAEYDKAIGDVGYIKLLEQAETDKKNLREEVTALTSRLTKTTNQLNNLRRSGLKFIQYAVIKLCEKFEIDLT